MTAARINFTSHPSAWDSTLRGCILMKDDFLETVRLTQTVHGTKAARAQAHAGLAVAEGRSQALRVPRIVQIVQK